MNIRRSVYILLIAALLLSACAAATPQTLVIEKQAQPNAQDNSSSQSGGQSAAPVVQATAAVAAQPQAEAGSIAPQPTAPLKSAPQSSAPLPGVPLPGVPLPTAPNAGVEFQNYGVNPYISAAEDHLSTFALDVDTASYSKMRSYIEQGSLPPADSVRVEEYINYFDQGYPKPANMAFGIYADGAPSPFSGDNAYLLRIGIQGYQVTEGQRKPLALTFLIDVSGSMQINNRLGLVKDSLSLLLDRLTAQDTVALVVYGSSARTVLQPTPANNTAAIKDAIASLYNEGSTNAEAGLLMAYDLAMRNFRPEASNRVILCSDGVANVGATDPEVLLSKVRGYVEEGVYLSTFGVGMGNYNDVLLEKLADEGNGSYAYIDDLEEARRLFVDNLTSTLQVIALNAKVQVDFNSDSVAYYRLIGYENRAVADQDFRNNAVDAGEIGAGHSATALYAVVLQPNAQGRVATVQLRWEDPNTHQVREINGNFNTYDLARSFSETDPHYQLTVLAAQYAEVLRRSPWAGSTTLGQLAGMAAEMIYNLPENRDASEFVQLLQKAAGFSR